MSFSSKGIARRIRETRKKRNLTQQDLADHLGRTSAAISDLERGKVQVNAVDLKKLADFLETPIEYFYGEDFGGDDVQELISIIRKSDPKTRDSLLPIIKAISEMQEVSREIQNVDPSDEQVLANLGERFYTILQPFLEHVGSLYDQGKELNEKLRDMLHKK